MYFPLTFQSILTLLKGEVRIADSVNVQHTATDSSHYYCLFYSISSVEV